MAKRKGSSPSFKRSPASGSRSRSKAAKEGSKAETSERGVDEKFQQLREEFRPLAEKRAKLEEQEREEEQNLEVQRRKLEEQRRKLEEQRRKLEEKLQPLKREVEQLQQNWLPKRNILMGVCNARQAENTLRLDKLPKEVWDKILDELEENDLFPLALSCRYFRQKQKEMVERTRQSGKRRRALKTNLDRTLHNRQPVSVEYLRFCTKEKVHWIDEYSRDEGIGNLAAFYGYLPLVQEILVDGECDGQEFTHNAGESSLSQSLLLLVSASDFFLPFSLSRILFSTARGGQLETLKWLITEGPDQVPQKHWLRSGHFAYACESGNFALLKWLRSEPFPCHMEASACERAAACGQLEVLKWLRSEGCPWDDQACTEAALSGHLETLKWLRSEGCPWYAGACQGAVVNGHLEILKWLRSEGCPWDEWTCTSAAKAWELDVLKWAIENGCPCVDTLDTRPALEELGLF